MGSFPESFRFLADKGCFLFKEEQLFYRWDNGEWLVNGNGVVRFEVLLWAYFGVSAFLVKTEYCTQCQNILINNVDLFSWVSFDYFLFNQGKTTTFRGIF